MENLKQEAIKKAYGEYWEKVKNYIDDNGWIEGSEDREFPEPKFEPSIGELEEHETAYLWRPKSLQGIESNNGWIRVKNDDWLKLHRIDKMRSKYYINNINEDYLSIAVLVTKDNIEFEQIMLSDYLTAKDVFTKEGIFATHYQPIQKSKPPIY